MLEVFDTWKQSGDQLVHFRPVRFFDLEQRGDMGPGGARASRNQREDLRLGEVAHHVQEVALGVCCGGGGGA